MRSARSATQPAAIVNQGRSHARSRDVRDLTDSADRLSSPALPVLEWQRLAGNRAVTSLLTRRPPSRGGASQQSGSRPSGVHPQVLRLQQAAGNGTAQLLGEQLRVDPASVQRDSDAPSWGARVARAKAAARAGRATEGARLYQLAIASAVPGAVFPTGLAKRLPRSSEIRLDLTMSSANNPSVNYEDAYTEGLEVEKAPDDYWQWIFFTDRSIRQTKAYTESLITHELVHAAQYRGVWEAFRDSGKSKTWKQFLLSRPGGIARQRGPEELEAHIAALRFVARMDASERRMVLRSIFEHYLQSVAYHPPKGTVPEITPARARTELLAAFSSGGAVADDLGREIWRATLNVSMTPSLWRDVDTNLKPILLHGYRKATPELRRLYHQIRGMVSVQREPDWSEPPAPLSVHTAAWTAGGRIGFGATSAALSDAAFDRLVTHELVHAGQQRTRGIDESVGARAQAENEATGAEVGNFCGGRPNRVPSLLAATKVDYAPFTSAWVGNSGLILEVVEAGVTVRIRKPYTELNADKLNPPTEWSNALQAKVKKQTDPLFFRTRRPRLPDGAKLASHMKKAAAEAAIFNRRIPAGSPFRVGKVLVTDTETQALRLFKGQALIFLKEKDMAGGLAVIRHELSHAIFERHTRDPKTMKAKPDVLGLTVTDIWNQLGATRTVAAPSSRWDPKRPPSTTVVSGGSPAGHLIVFDTLWAGSGGHPWDGPDEFFASAFAGWITAPQVLRQISAHYSKADAKITPLAKQLFALLDRVKRRRPLQGVAKPKGDRLTAAVQAIGEVKAPSDLGARGANLQKGAWVNLIDPTTYP